MANGYIMAISWLQIMAILWNKPHEPIPTGQLGCEKGNPKMGSPQIQWRSIRKLGTNRTNMEVSINMGTPKWMIHN